MGKHIAVWHLVNSGFMQEADSEIPAWMLCEDIFNKIKTELITEAMDTLQEAIKSKVIEVNGSLVNLPDKPSDTEMDMFIINKILEEKDSIKERYANYLNYDYSVPEKLAQKERIQKFLMYIDQISLLMHYANSINAWIGQVGMYPNEKDPSKIIANTTKENEGREILIYVINSKKMEKEKILTQKEIDILKSTM